MTLIECKIELDLRCARNFVISEAPRAFREVDPNGVQVEHEVTTLATGATFVLYINDNIKSLENIRQWFKSTISRLFQFFFLLFKNGNDDPTRNCFDEYYMPLAIKDFDALIDNKPFFYQTVKNKQKGYEKLVEMSKSNYYTTGKLLDYLYHQKYYKHRFIKANKYEYFSTN